MNSPSRTYIEAGAIALQHLTGRCRGRMTWLNGATLDICLDDACIPHIREGGSETEYDDVAAHLSRDGDTYTIAAPESRSLWVNGVNVKTQNLKNGDLIEFGDDGPLSRFRIFREDQRVKKSVTDILRDGLLYFRVSRKPFAARLIRAFTQLCARLAQETTLLYRAMVVIALLGLTFAVYQQGRVSSLIQERIASDTERIEDFAAALTRTRDEALRPGDLIALREEVATRLTSASDRLEALEQRSQASARVIANSLPSVVFLQGAYGFQERSSGRMLRHVVDADGSPEISPRGQPLLTLDGDGPLAERQFNGTGFAVGDGRTLVTNRHVALPWENDTNISAMAKKGVEPVMLKFIAYAPDIAESGTVDLIRTSDEADLAILRLEGMLRPLPSLPLADIRPAPGAEIIVMGYPTGLRSLLAQSGEEFIVELQETDDTGFWSVAARLARRGYIAPLASRGIVGQVSLATIVYDAETTHGGSGGPVLDTNGAVIAVNTAILPEFGGSNLGIPVAKVRALIAADAS
jgi:serine protease Do